MYKLFVTLQVTLYLTFLITLFTSISILPISYWLMETQKCAVKWVGVFARWPSSLTRPNLAYGNSEVCGQLGRVVAHWPNPT